MCCNKSKNVFTKFEKDRIMRFSFIGPIRNNDGIVTGAGE